MFLTGGTARALRSYANGLDRYFDERIDRAHALGDPPPIPGEHDSAEISAEKAGELFQILCAQQDLAMVRYCVSVLRKFITQRLKHAGIASDTTLAA